MNTKSNIFTRGSATRENTAFGVHSVKNKNQSYSDKVKYPLCLPKTLPCFCFDSHTDATECFNKYSEKLHTSKFLYFFYEKK